MREFGRGRGIEAVRYEVRLLNRRGSWEWGKESRCEGHTDGTGTRGVRWIIIPIGRELQWCRKHRLRPWIMKMSSTGAQTNGVCARETLFGTRRATKVDDNNIFHFLSAGLRARRAWALNSSKTAAEIGRSVRTTVHARYRRRLNGGGGVTARVLDALPSQWRVITEVRKSTRIATGRWATYEIWLATNVLNALPAAQYDGVACTIVPASRGLDILIK